MMLTPTTSTKFGVARKREIVGDLYDVVGDARQQVAHIADTMTSVGVKPDVRLVQVEVTTTYGDLEDYSEPEPEAEPDDEPVDVKGEGASLDAAADDLIAKTQKPATGE